MNHALGRLHEDKNELEKFEKWAFGDDFINANYQDIPKLWNQRHGKQLELIENGSIFDDINKMVELWENAKFMQEKN